MQNLIRNLIVQFREFYKNLSPMKRMSMLMASFILVVAAGAVVLLATGRDFAPLLSNVPSDQLPAIVAKLQSQNIPFRIEKDGTTISVPKDLVHSTQMAIMTEMGSSKIGTVGLEIFDKQDFGTTSYAQRINYQRALQGELMRAINTIDAVKQSKVILALPPKKTFLEEGGVPSASVVVELQTGKTLSPDQVKGITFLVASAVEGMDASHVTVVDSRGKVLSRASDGLSALSSDLLEMKEKREHEMEDRVQDILERVVGRGKAIVKVDATLSQRNVATVEETVDPDKTAILSQTNNDESLDGTRNNPTGVPGARSNLPGAQDTGTVGFNQNVHKETKTVNYDVPKTVRNIKEGPGAIEKLTVAVLVDGVTEMAKNADGKMEEQWHKRSPEELAQFESLVKNAVGFNAARGDSVKIENIKFDKEDFSEADKMLTSLERKKLLRDLMKWSLLAFSLGLFFFMVIRPFMRWITDSFQDSVEDMLPRTIEELEELQSVDNTLPGMSGALPILEESLDPDKAESELLRERIMNLMGTDEEKAAGAFSLWLVRKDT